MKRSEHVKVLQARVSGSRLQKLETIKQYTGLTTSTLIRQLIDAVEVEPAKINVNLATNSNSDVTTLQGTHVAVVA